MFIYVVGFCPASRENGEQTGGIAGFDWFETPPLARDHLMQNLAKDFWFESDHVIRRVWLPDNIVGTKEIDAYLNDNPDLWNSAEQLFPKQEST